MNKCLNQSSLSSIINLNKKFDKTRTGRRRQLMESFDMFKNKEEFIEVEIQRLIEWDEHNGVGCLASDKITKGGFKVGYMYREEPSEGGLDSGWRFLAGNEDDEYTNNPNNLHIFDINTICNYDKDIIPYLKSPIGSAYVRVSNNRFEIDNGSQPIFVEKQNR